MECPKCHHRFSASLVDTVHHKHAESDKTLCGKVMAEGGRFTTQVSKVNCGWCLKIISVRSREHAAALEKMIELQAYKAKELMNDLGPRDEIR